MLVFSFHSTQHHGVGLNRCNVINATQGNIHKSRNKQMEQMEQLDSTDIIFGILIPKSQSFSTLNAIGWNPRCSAVKFL